jgi:hypothetical protein
VRFLVKVYEDGGLFAVETSDDGSEIVRTLKGSREVGKRLSAFVEVLGDETPEGVARIQAALAFLSETVSRRGD